MLLSRLHHQPGGRGVRRGERGELLERHADALLRVTDPGAQADLSSAKLLLGDDLQQLLHLLLDLLRNELDQLLNLLELLQLNLSDLLQLLELQWHDLQLLQDPLKRLQDLLLRIAR